MKVSTISQVQQYWDKFSEDYSKLERNMNSFYYSLVNMLRVEERNHILEVGAGTGFLINHSLVHKQPTATYTATDLSEGMLKILCKRAGIEFKKDEPSKVEALNFTVQQANSEALPFADSSFDCYIANLCLHITTDPEQMLAEAFRVLQPNGVAGFSVWGDKEASNYFTLFAQTIAELNLNSPEDALKRSNFHLNNRENMIAMLEKAGFVNIICWNQFTPIHFRETEVEVMLNSPQLAGLISKFPEKKELIKENLTNRIKGILHDQKRPLGLDGLLVIAQKPSA